MFVGFFQVAKYNKIYLQTDPSAMLYCRNTFSFQLVKEHGLGFHGVLFSYWFGYWVIWFVVIFDYCIIISGSLAFQNPYLLTEHIF